MAIDMAQAGGATPSTPPYAAYVSFDAFIQRAASEPVPALVDKALLVSWTIAAGNESGVLTTLRSLGLVDDAGRPTELYREIRLSPTRRIPALRRCLEFAYPGLPSTGQRIDNDRLHDYFVEERSLTGQMVSKAMRFYRQIVAATTEDTSTADRGTDAPSPSRRAASSTVRHDPDRNVSGLSESSPARELTSRVRRQLGEARRGSELGISVQITISAEATEEELTSIFRRVRRAWTRSRPGKSSE